MTAETASVAGIAQAFHEAYERLAPLHGYETREASARPWEDVPAQNRDLMTATVGALLADGVIAPPPASRDALAALAAKWETEAVELAQQAKLHKGVAAAEMLAAAIAWRQAARALLAAIGAKP